LAVVALAKAVSELEDPSGKTARRNRPEPALRTSTATPQSAFFPR
jgi:hypothetical protein